MIVDETVFLLHSRSMQNFARRAKELICFWLILEQGAIHQLAVSVGIHGTLNWYMRNDACRLARAGLLSVRVAAIGNDIHRYARFTDSFMSCFSNRLKTCAVVACGFYLVSHDQCMGCIHSSLNVVRCRGSMRSIH